MYFEAGKANETAEILQAFKYLSQVEKNVLVEFILSGTANLSGESIAEEKLSADYSAVHNLSEGWVSEENYAELLNDRFKNHDEGCPVCGSTYIVKNGRNSNNKQRYRCNDCRKVFSSTTNSPLMYTKKTIKDWINYLKCMSNGLSIRDSAKKVGIHRNTSFQWRHKILNALKASLKEELSGIVEIDETLINESFKGNHSKDEDFRMERAPRKRGVRLSQCTSPSKVRVLCCRDRGNNIFSAVAGRIRPDLQRLMGMLKDKIADGSTICTNRNLAYIAFAKKLNLKLYKLINFKEIKEEVYHIQNAWTFGRQLKSFLIGFHGVATKYLNYYITWLKWKCLSGDKSLGFGIKDIFFLVMGSRARLRVCDFRLVSSMPSV